MFKLAYTNLDIETTSEDIYEYSNTLFNNTSEYNIYASV